MAKRVDNVEQEAKEVLLACELIRLGARMQLLEAEIPLSRDRLLKLYKEVRGVSPPKGMLPFSTDWFVSWQPNVHATLFANFWTQLTERDERRRLITSYQLYLDALEALGIEPILSITRAWTLIRFLHAELLQLTPCSECGGHFVTHAYEPEKTFVCGLCYMPSRATTAQKPHKHQLSTAQKSMPVKENRRRVAVAEVL